MGEEIKSFPWSHSSLNNIMNNPAEYYLNYIQGIKPKIEKTALSIGSAVHWGLEHETSDLSEYYNEKGNFRQWNNYTDEQLLAECIVEAYLRMKPEIYKQILTDEETGEVLEIVDEQHEITMVCHIDSRTFKDGHDFLGIIDLLFLTKKGWILIDYKTGSQAVDYDEYKSQLFKYILNLQKNFPDVPIYKIAVIHLRKTGIKRKKNENDTSYRSRIKMEYDLNEDNLIEAHVYQRKEFDDNQLQNFEKDLSEQMDIARLIKENKLYFVNYTNVKGMYGPSQYYDIFYKKVDNYLLYIIKDKIYDPDDDELLTYRDCDPIDMMVLDNPNILNKYDKFKDETTTLLEQGFNTKDKIYAQLKKKFICSDNLLDKYLTTFNKGY